MDLSAINAQTGPGHSTATNAGAKLTTTTSQFPYRRDLADAQKLESKLTSKKGLSQR